MNKINKSQSGNDDKVKWGLSTHGIREWNSIRQWHQTLTPRADNLFGELSIFRYDYHKHAHTKTCVRVRVRMWMCAKAYNHKSKLKAISLYFNGGFRLENHISHPNTHINKRIGIWKITKHQIRNNMLNYYSWSVLEIGVFENVFQKFEKNIYLFDIFLPTIGSAIFFPVICNHSNSIYMYFYPYRWCLQIFLSFFLLQSVDTFYMFSHSLSMSLCLCLAIVCVN